MATVKNSILVLLTLFISACATVQVDMIAEGDVKVAAIKSADVTFSKLDVHEHGGVTEIEVVVRPRKQVKLFSVGSINVLVTRPDGSQRNLVTDKAHVDRHRTGSTLQHAHFIITVPYVIPSGSTLTLSYFPAKIEKKIE